MARTRQIQLAAVSLLLCLGVAVSLALRAAPEPAREVRLEARGMSFYLEGSATANPAIEAAPGERLRLVLVNRDRGFEHDLRLPGLGAATALLGEGRSGAVTLRLPEVAGEYRYDCSLHARMMAGSLVVR